jgi:ribonuclease D
MSQTDTQVLETLNEPILVYNPSTFAQMINHLRQQPLVAIDTESDSLFSYYPKVCLIQISTWKHVPGAAGRADDDQEVVDYIVDPLRLDDISELGLITADPAIEIIMHAASNDILLLQRDFQFEFNAIFDTQLAARILGWKRVGLAATLEGQFGVISDKRMQRTNWGRRPLTPQQLAYAQLDTHFLLALRQILLDELRTQGREEEAYEAFQLLAEVDYQERTAPERTFWNMKTTRNVDRKDTGVLEALWEWREREAQRQNRPPFKIVTDQVLTTVATGRPRSQKELQRIRGLSSSQVKRYGQQMLAVVKKAAKRPLPDLPPQRSRPEATLEQNVLDRYEELRQWRTRTARRRGVDPDIIFNNETLMSIAKLAPDSTDTLQEISQIGPWKAKTYGSQVLDIIARHPE